MARMSHFVGMAALGLILTGCVSQEKYNALKLDRDALAEQLGQSQSEARAARAEADILKNQIAALGTQGGNWEGLINNLNSENAALRAQLNELNSKYAEAMSRPIGGTALPAALSNELSAFAAQNPDLVEFDAARGIVKFKSDVTFATGSADLQPKARDVIGRFAGILNSAAASGYELLVAGHTDNTRVVNPNTIAAGHKDNWYLSAHRAISVGSALQSQNVNPQRIGVVGYADQRPVASNASESGKAQNRRVEVLILPTQVRGGGSGIAGGSSAPAARQPARPNKDATVNTDNRPVLSK
jgi:chemotaxis protein MotB